MTGGTNLDVHDYILHIRRLYSWRKGEWISLRDGKSYELCPDEFIIVETYERIGLAKNMGATIHGLARLTRQGLSHISTTVHPGWGEEHPEALRIGVRNCAPWPLVLRDKDRIARILFWRGEVPASLVSAPGGEEIFQYMEAIIKKYQNMRNALQRFYIFIASLFTLVAIIAVSYFIHPTSIWWILGKTIIVTLLGLWITLLFRKMF